MAYDLTIAKVGIYIILSFVIGLWIGSKWPEDIRQIFFKFRYTRRKKEPKVWGTKP